MGETGMPMELVDQIAEALAGHSSDAEHDALVAVAQEFGIVVFGPGS